ncbi:MAG: hypothetical protein RLZ51_692, partial [Pseudomonadota bacterium]
QTVAHPSEGPIRAVRPPTLFSASPAELARHAPRIGEHTLDVLREAGLCDQEIAQLQQRGTILCA